MKRSKSRSSRRQGSCSERMKLSSRQLKVCRQSMMKVLKRWMMKSICGCAISRLCVGPSMIRWCRPKPKDKISKLSVLHKIKFLTMRHTIHMALRATQRVPTTGQGTLIQCWGNQNQVPSKRQQVAKRNLHRQSPAASTWILKMTHSISPAARSTQHPRTRAMSCSVGPASSTTCKTQPNLGQKWRKT